MVNLPFGDDVYHPFIAIYGHFIFIGFICWFYSSDFVEATCGA
jgi:hypothetical protein